MRKKRLRINSLFYFSAENGRREQIYDKQSKNDKEPEGNRAERVQISGYS